MRLKGLLLAMGLLAAVATASALKDAPSALEEAREIPSEEQLPVEGTSTWSRIELFVIASLQLILVLVSYRLDRAKSPVLISESVCAMFFGVLFGVVVRFMSPTDSIKHAMDPEVLFYALLPPIILEAGFSMKKRGFFANFSTILLLAGVGTLIAMFAIGGMLLWLGNLGLITQLTASEAYLYGALISAVDPVATLSVFKKNGVPSLLFNLVFGESMLNDGVAIVAFTLFQRLIKQDITDVTLHDMSVVVTKVFGIGLGSVFLAAVVCSTSAFLLKHADPALRNYPSYEISIVLLSAYLSYVAADIAGLSGIVALFFSGVWMSHYHLHTIAEESATALRHLLSTAAFVAENFIFIYLGMSVVAYSGYFTWDWGFILFNMVACLVARILSTFPLCMIANLGRQEQIPWSYMVVIWFAGLRGAIAFALALNVWTPDKTHSGVIQSTTLFTVMFTTVVFGMGTSPLLRRFGLASREEPGMELDEANESLLSDHDNEDGQTDHRRFDDDEYDLPRRRRHSGIHGMWERFDEKYLKPLFGGYPRILQQNSTMKTFQRSTAGQSSSSARATSPGSSAALSPRGRGRSGSNSHGSPTLSMAEIAQEYS
ncbi:hypothetical protein Poli38472_004017 [Pythium oligandrum]|uniref:Sodium/hydrogen exchanger n=1 Tax=Pythium oligandrum TaxID=41045 RepID=A0A8K1CPI2_PYTOL|nr:hypothetical protein Poli38472_004017 [Pythium oligandrum]|eukprot:TMW66252.1 hypothetical protein Poli38472_004017 [Pythium oligandrum]